MPVMRPSLAAAVTLGGFLAALGGAGAAAADDAPFGAPAASATAGFLPAPPLTGRSPAARTAATGMPWMLDRQKPQEATSQPDETRPATEPNLGALRFYASQNDLARVAAEIRLLRAKFPGWEPPSDLFTETRSGESEQPLWDLFARHDLAGLKDAIAQRRQATPGWQPSADLAGKLALTEAGDALVRASDAKDDATVADIATANRGLMTCATIDAIWRTAESLVRLDDEAHAVEAYRYILANCVKPQERLATAQKAELVIKSPEAMEGLLRMGRRLPNGASEFADLRLDAVRRRVGEAAAGKATAEPSPADLDQLAVRARQPDGGGDAALLGWYALAHKDFAGAETWFHAAMQPTASPKAAEGLVLALRDGGKLEEAMRLAPGYAALGPLNRKLAMEVQVAGLADAKTPLTPDQLVALGAAIDAEKSADAAQSFGWSRFKANDIAGAAGWFRKSLTWQPSEAAAIGAMVTAKRLHQGADYAQAVTTYKAAYPRVAELDAVMRDRPARVVPKGRAARPARAPAGEGWDQGATDIVRTFEGGHLDEALAMMDARRARRVEPRGLEVVRAWALYKKGDWDGAKRTFADVGNRGFADEARKGLSQIDFDATPRRFR